MRGTHRQLLALALFALGASGLAGCAGAQLKPWVSPYQRNQLADPIMSFDRATASQGYMVHVFQAREGARGAEGGSGGGCGCN